MVDVDGIFCGGGEGFAFMEGGETAPCDDFAGCFGDDDGVSGGAVGEPCGAVFGGFGGDLERAGGGEDVVVVDGVDGVEVGGGGVAEGWGGHGGGGMEKGEGRRTGGLQQKPQPARGIECRPGGRWRRLLGDLEDPVHEAPVARERADVGVVTGIGWGGEFDEIALADADEFGAFDDDVLGVRVVELLEGFRVGEHFVGESADGVFGAWFEEDEVVLERALFIAEEEHDFGARLDGEFLFVVLHHVWNDAEHEFGGVSRGGLGVGRLSVLGVQSVQSGDTDEGGEERNEQFLHGYEYWALDT